MSTKPNKPVKKPDLVDLNAEGDSIVKFVDVMKQVKTSGKEATLNESSSDDNNVGRYWYHFFKHLKPGKAKR